MPKKSSDINKPRPPVTAYNLFVRTCRDELRRKHPQLTVEYNVISRKCSERWKVMNDQEKKRFNDTADSQRKRYKDDMATYVQEQSVKQQTATSSILLQTPATQYLPEPVSSPLVQHHSLSIPIVAPAVNGPGMVTIAKKAVKKRERKQKDPFAPKKPLSAYFLFCADERPKVQSSQPGMPVSDIARELGARWKMAPMELKTKYEQIAVGNKNAYRTEMENYKHQTSGSSSPPETPQTPLNPHEYQGAYSLPSQQHPQLQQLLLQQQNFNSFDHSDLMDGSNEFDLMAADNAIDDDDD